MSTLAYLASFHTTCQTLNISAAAKLLGITQPALSKQLKRLEDSLGTVLFVRRQRGIALTEDGSRLAESIAPVLTTLDDRLNLLRGQSGSLKGRLRVGSLTEIGKTRVLPRILAFAQDYPEIEIELRFQTGAEIIQALQAAELDFGVVVEQPAIETLKTSRLDDERSLLVTRATNRRAISTSGDVLASGFVAYRHDDPLLQGFLKLFFPGVNRKRIRPRIAVNDHRSMIEALLGFDLYAVMPMQSVAGFIEAGTLRNASEHELHSKIWLVRPEKARETLVTTAFVKVLA